LIKAIDLLGRELSVGDHVVWAAGGRHGWGIRHGFIKSISESYGRAEVKTSIAPGSTGAGKTTWAENVCKVVLP